MVKNTTGGSRHKKQARRNINAEDVHKRTRLKDPKEPCEIYAIITKNFGQGNCEVLCNDGKHRVCVIRNKFKGRNKRSNRVDVGIRVLVGLRDWEVRAGDKKEKCDLLEVYDNRELNDLKKDPNFDEALLKSEQEMSTDDNNGNAFFEFAYNTTIPEEDTSEGTVQHGTAQLDGIADFNFDDI